MRTPNDIIPIPVIKNTDMYQSNVDKADSMKLEHCPCCGKAITNPKYFINSIYGGDMYKADDIIPYKDAWIMAVGPECAKKFPIGYIFK